MLYLCHLPGLGLRLRDSPGADSLPHLCQHSPLADKDTEDEEASEKVETVDDSEEYFNAVCLDFTIAAIMAAVDEIMKAGECPENTKERKEFAIQNLQKGKFEGFCE